MKTMNMEKIIERYNNMMFALCLEHVTIGTEYSEDTEGWNLRDMVAEADYWLGIYNEAGTASGDMRYSDDPDERKAWRSESGKLRRFIDAYKTDIGEIECVSKHCSIYDN